MACSAFFFFSCTPPSPSASITNLENAPTDLLTGHCNGGNSSNEILSSQIRLALCQANQNQPSTIGWDLSGLDLPLFCA